MLPMALIEALAYGSFAVPREDVADRLSVSLTMVLTAVAFKQIIAAELPNVSYLTLLDVFVLASFASTCLVAFENIVVGQVASSPEGDATLADMDAILSIVFPAEISLNDISTPNENCHHTYPKTESVRYSLAYSHNFYSYPQIFFSYRTG